METSGRTYDIGMVGLGVMGRNLVLNMADHGIAAAGYDLDTAKVEALRTEAKGHAVFGAATMSEFAGALRRPRAVMLLVPAGAPVDAVIAELLTVLEPGDLIIDAGNSYFKDTDVRIRTLASKGMHFLGVGISGGEDGARRGPSIMPGGAKDAYETVRPIFESIAASVQGEPCVTWLGPGSSGHFVKMVHNGIEYGVMQLIAEAYDMMKRGLGMNDDELRDIFAAWNDGELNGYLMEITSRIFSTQDEKTGRRLVDEIRDAAAQKGTGMWASQSAMELHVPIPTIDTAVAMRDLSVIAEERTEASAVYPRAQQHVKPGRTEFLSDLARALTAGMIIVYAQGMAHLKAASRTYNYQLDLEAVARIWRGGCIIRAGLLEEIRSAFHAKHDLDNLLLSPFFSRKLNENEGSLRRVIISAAETGVPVPALMASLGYLDAYRSSWLPANLIQAQRDYFGAHTYERIDAKGTFHTEWKKD
jgi:6-phosphogluconate dehydrogenase